jgi:DNA replication and repair protein RecF
VVKFLKIQNFRNYEKREIKFEPGINTVLGENGRGKTNLLEALFFLLKGRSMRTSDVKEMIRDEEEEAVVEGHFDLGREIVKRVVLSKEGTTERNRGGEEIGVVSFQPDDIWMVKGGPEVRRRCTDEVVLDLKRGYKETMREYQRILRQRNEALKEVRKGLKEKEYVRSWNPLLLEYGKTITDERKAALKGMLEEMGDMGNRWEKGSIEAKYYTTLSEKEEEVKERLSRLEDLEIRRGISLTGPHRDEILFYMGGRNARRECSQGEQKLLALMWRLAHAAAVEKRFGKKPILLMDDCLSELDRGNRVALLQEMKKWEQVVVTTTDDMEELSSTHRIDLGKGSHGIGEE